MVYVISYNIRRHYRNSIAEGQEYYRKYFFDTEKYLAYKDGVDAQLIAWGVGDCIVTE